MAHVPSRLSLSYLEVIKRRVKRLFACLAWLFALAVQFVIVVVFLKMRRCGLEPLSPVG